MKKDLLSLHDYSKERIKGLIRLAARLKKERKQRKAPTRSALDQKNVAMIFEKPSLRTRVTFEVAMNDLGGNVIYLAPENIQIGKRESVKDVSMNLERWVDGIVARTFSQRTVEEMSIYANVPVINALSDMYHPCQALAFGQTFCEQFGEFKHQRIVFVGDGNNVCHSLMLMCAKLGLHFMLAHPEGYGASDEVLRAAKKYCRSSRGSVGQTCDLHAAVRKADFVYTDTWTSMGQEREAIKREEVFAPYQVNTALMKKAPKHCRVSHCLPAHRGQEITDEILDQSVAFDEAENRLHAQKAVLLELLG